MNCPDILDSYRELVQTRLNVITESLGSSPMKEPLESLLKQGKRVRPIITLLSSEAVGGDVSEALPAAVAIELLHTASLIHDDMMDSASMRRGQPTVHAAYGDKMGLLCGDFLVSLAYEEMFRLKEPYNVSVLHLMNQTYKELCEGQALEEWVNDSKVLTPEALLEVIEKKTASLIYFAAKSGAIIGGSPEEDVDLFGSFGRSLGFAFQIQDDLLDLVGCSQETGKDTSLDEKNNKTTWVGTLGVNGEMAKIDVAEKKVKEYLSEAIQCLQQIQSSEAKDNLKGFVQYLMNRRS